MEKIISYKSLDKDTIEGIGFNVPRMGKNGSRYVYFSYPNNEVWFIQTPKVRIPFEPYDTSFCINVDNQSFKECITNIEDYIIRMASEKSMQWFEVYKSVEEVRNIYVSMLTTLANNKDFPPFLKVNFTNSYEIYNIDGSLVDKTFFKKGVYAKFIIKLSKIYIKVDENGYTMKCFLDLEQARISKPNKTETQTTMDSYSFLD